MTEQFELRDDKADDHLRESTPAGEPGTNPFEERGTPKLAFWRRSWWHALRKDQEQNPPVLTP